MRQVLIFVALPGFVTPARSESEMPAGGAFMSSYTSDPDFNPRSQYFRRHALGDIGEQPMLAEQSGAQPPCALFDKPCADRFERTRRHADP
ncbi:hypothetical protein FV242_22455 [Methylobacterium sp. WL64]|nr:hypothetical protein FV242_22455 [Methylobacterium sp. WL64]